MLSENALYKTYTSATALHTVRLPSLRISTARSCCRAPGLAGVGVAAAVRHGQAARGVVAALEGLVLERVAVDALAAVAVVHREVAALEPDRRKRSRLFSKCVRVCDAFGYCFSILSLN